MTPPVTLEQDRTARRRAQTELARPLMLEAGAGTGKTTTLVARVLAWCLGPGWERHHRRAEERQRERGRTEPPAADAVAAAVLERVVAITFTEDAAAEMAQRVARQLARLAADPEAPMPDWLHLPEPAPAERARRAGALLATLDRLVVRTIHAFCRGLLADHPLEAGLHPDLTVDADGLLLEEVARETVETRLRTFYGDEGSGDGGGGSNPYLQLAARGVGPRELVEALVVLSQAGVPADGLDPDPLAPARVGGLLRRLRDACADLDALVAARCSGMPERMKASRLAAALAGVLTGVLGGALADGERGAGAPGAGGADFDALLAALADAFPDNLVQLLGDWGKVDGKLSQRETEAFADCRPELAAAATRLRALLANLGELDPELLRLAHGALAPLHREVRRELRARGIVTFEDLLAEAARLLAEHPAVAAGARAGIEQLLVDEFQDTDALQCEIVARLGLEGPEDRRPGLFLVGDPKQSIYGWRSADLASYDAFRARLLAAGGACLPLVRNFRSVPAILEEVERTVGPVMQEAPGLQPPYQVLLPDDRLVDDPGFVGGAGHGEDRAGNGAENGGTGDGGGLRRAAVEHWVSWRRREDADDPDRTGDATPRGVSYELEADALARDVRDLHDAEGVPWAEVAVLLRSTSDLDVYLEALRRHGVPFAVGRDKQYYRRREVIDAAALVRCVLDPGDHLALLTVLRSPWVGVPDAALVPLWNRGFPDRMTRLQGSRPLHEIRELVEAAAAEVATLGPEAVPGLDRVGGWELSLVAAVEQLAAARRAFREQPADAFVDTLRHLFLPEPLAAARYLGVYRLANLERFFRRLVTALEDGGGDVTAVLRALRRSVTEAREAPEGRPQAGGGDAVQVLTMHQAKGLDFGHVYLPQLHKESGGGTPSTVVERLPAEAGDAGPATSGGGFEMKLFGAPTLGFDRVEARNRQVEAAERVRLLYVAMTRPKRRLVLLGGWPAEAGGAAPEPERARHFLDLLAHRRPLPEPPLAESWEAATDAFTDPAGALWRFPALTSWPAAAARSETRPEPPDPHRVAAAAVELVGRREGARSRMARPFSAAASEESHHLLRQALAGPEGTASSAAAEAEGEGGHPALSRTAAMAVGTALHHLLEMMDLAADPAAELERLRPRIPALLAAELPGGEGAAAVAQAEGIVDGLLDGGRLLARLAEIAPGVLGREVPLLLAPPPVEDAAAAAAAAAPGAGPPPPVGFLSGAIDLLYRDPEDGCTVVADHKTDAVEDGDALAARAALYADQGRHYVRAVQAALGLAEPPRFELWFLRADRVHRLDPEGGGGTPPRDEPAGPEQISLFDLD